MRERNITARLYAALILAYLLLAVVLAWVYPASPGSRTVAMVIALLAVVALLGRVLVGLALRKTASGAYSCTGCNYAATLRQIEQGQPLPCHKCGRIIYIDR